VQTALDCRAWWASGRIVETVRMATPRNDDDLAAGVSPRLGDTTWLVRSACTGDRRALDELMSRHRQRLLALIHIKMPAALVGRLEAQDIVQEASLEVARKIASFDPERGSSFYAWIAGIAKFKLREAQRHAQAAKRAGEEPYWEDRPADQTSLVGRVARREVGQSLRKTLESLPQDQAKAVELRFFEGLSVEETASRMRRSSAAIKALVARGLRSMGRRIQEGG